MLTETVRKLCGSGRSGLSPLAKAMISLVGVE